MDKAKAEWARRSIPPEKKTAGGDGTFPYHCHKWQRDVADGHADFLYAGRTCSHLDELGR